MGLNQEDLAGASLSALLWVSTYSLNRWVFQGLAHSDWATWIFLPAAVRLLAVLLWREAGAVGLFVGAVVTNALFGSLPWAEALSLSALSALAPWLALQIGQRALRVSDTLAGLTPQALGAFAALSAGISGLIHALYLRAVGLTDGFTMTLASMVIGDFLGAFLVLYALRVGLRRLPLP